MPHQLHLAVVLPEWESAFAIRASYRSSPRRVIEYLIENDLLNEHYRYSCEFVTGSGRLLDSYLPLREQTIKGGSILYMRVRQPEPVHG